LDVAADLQVGLTGGQNAGAGLPPSLKLRRTAEALAEAGQARPWPFGL